MTIKDLTKNNWSQEVQSKKFAVVEFWAEWCGFCKQLAPVYEEISNEILEVDFLNVNTDKQLELAQQYGIKGLPTIKFFSYGKEVGSISGFRPKDDLVADINAIKAEAEICAENISVIP